MMNSTIEQYPQITLLGVTIDDKLTFASHVSRVCKKVSRQVGVISRLRNMILTKAKLQIFKSAILPHLTYCQTIWHHCCSSDSRKVERVQERGLRAVYCNKSATYEELLRMANLPTLYNRRLQEIAIIMYKVKYNIAPSYISDLFTISTSRYALRNSDFTIPRFNTVTHGKHTIRYLGPTIWAKLSEDLRMAKTLKIFKTRIRTVNLSEIMSDNCKICILCSN